MSASLPVIVTICVLVFLAIFVVVGFIRGFLRVLFTTFSLLVVMSLSALLAAPVGNFLQYRTSIGISINDSVSSYIDKQIDQKKQELIAEAIAEAQNSIQDSLQDSDIPDIAGVDTSNIDISEYAGIIQKESSENLNIDDYIDVDSVIASMSEEELAGCITSLPLPSFVKNLIIENNNDETYEDLGVSTFSEYAAAQLTGVATKAIAFLALLILLYIFSRILFHVLGIISKIPIFHGINRLLGAVLGLGEGILILWILCIPILLLSGTDFGANCLELIAQSKFLSFIYNNNVLYQLYNVLSAIIK